MARMHRRWTMVLMFAGVATTSGAATATAQSPAPGARPAYPDRGRHGRGQADAAQPQQQRVDRQGRPRCRARRDPPCARQRARARRAARTAVRSAPSRAAFSGRDGPESVRLLRTVRGAGHLWTRSLLRDDPPLDRPSRRRWPAPPRRQPLGSLVSRSAQRQRLADDDVHGRLNLGAAVTTRRACTCCHRPSRGRSA